jgi:hypothetical protein
MRTVRPAWDKVLARHPSILFEIESKISWKAAALDLPKKKGRPRYLEETDAYLKGKIPPILLIVDNSVFLLK